MKTLLVLFLFITLVSVRCQTVTNVDIRATTTVIVTGVSTNSANTTLSLVYSTAKDKVRIDGLAYACGVARTPQGGNFTNTFDNWIAKSWAKDNADVTARAKLQADAAATLTKLSDLLNNNYDLLTAGDISNLNSIAAKSPITP